jgi:predicted nucleic acid-binding protein
VSAAASPGLVDASSFIVMRERGIDTAFTFDRDFKSAGFSLVTESD